MLSKYSTEYSTLLNALGITGLLPNIPANILDADNDQINAMRIALASVKRTLHDRKTTERLITRLICGMLPPRGMRKAEPTSTRFYRGFFIVSDTRLTESDIHVKHQRVLRITGGKCLQTLVHYHRGVKKYIYTKFSIDIIGTASMVVVYIKYTFPCIFLC